MSYAPYSYSKLNLFLTCPAAFKLRYIDKVPSVKSPALIVGDLAHKAVAQYIQYLATSGQQTDQSKWDEIVKAYLRLAGEYQEELEACLSRFEFVLPPVQKVIVEGSVALNRELSLTRFDSKDAWFRGKIDYLYFTDHAAVVTDWKTNRYVPKQPHIEKDLQTRCYAMFAFFLKPEIEEAVVQLHYLRASKVLKARVTRQEVIDTVLPWIRETVSLLEREREWAPKPGNHCSWCEYVEKCPMNREVLTFKEEIPVSLETPEDALEVAKLYRFLGALKSRLKEKLEGWVQKNGPIELDGEVLDFHEIEKVEWPTPEHKHNLAKFLLDQGLSRSEIWEVFSISKTGLERTLKGLGRKDLIPEALETGETVSGRKFEFKKK